MFSQRFTNLIPSITECDIEPSEAMFPQDLLGGTFIYG